MKFAHEYKAALEKEGFPKRWVDSAVPYGQLKKVIKKVARELEQNGLDVEKLSKLQGLMSYEFDDNKHPRLTILYENDMAIDATLSAGAVSALKDLADQHGVDIGTDVTPDEPSDTAPQTPDPSRKSSLATDNGPVIRRVEVPLTMDTEFFRLLQGHVIPIEKIRDEEQKALENEIRDVSQELTVLTRPSKYGKTDMYRWRELFDVYLQAAIFFSTNEQDHGSRNSSAAKRQLEWFQSEIKRRNLVEKFKLPSSQQALLKFYHINEKLWDNLRYQELSEKAIGKILKKFDKRTHLQAREPATKLILPASSMTETMAKAVCSQVSTDIVKVTPQLDDYLCPICFTIAWRPIKMICGHIFCLPCTVTMQKTKKKFCPLCRGNHILSADEDNIDMELGRFLKKYFPKETREKRIEIEKAAGIEEFGIYYKHPSESKLGHCLIM